MGDDDNNDDSAAADDDDDDDAELGSMVADPDNDGKKCPMKPGSDRTFKLTGGKASLETCAQKCSDDPACVAFSAQIGKWSIGCKEALSENHKGAKAFKKSDQGGDSD